MKICVLTHTFPRFFGDPSAPFIGNLAEALVDQGNEVIVLAPFDPKLDLKLKRKYQVKCYKYIFPDNLHTLGYSRTLQGDKSLKLETYILSPLMIFFGFLSLLKLVKEEKIDIISAHWIIPNGFIAALVSKITGVSFTATIPGSDIYLGGKNGLFKWMVGFASAAASVVLSDSQYYLNQLKDLGFNPKRTDVIRYGVNTDKFKSTEKDKVILKQLGINENSEIILAVGRLVAKKGFLYLIKSMPDILKEIKIAKLVIVGDGDQRGELENEVDKLDIRDQVIFAGTISYDQLSKYYNLGDIFVMPSVRDEDGNIDASPVAMMEAMACGTPVIATKFSGSDELVKSGETGFLVNEKQPEEIAKAVINLLNKGTNKKRKEEVRKIAIENFSTETVARRYISHFEFALSKK